MHRSGTSAATRVVNLLGAQLGDRMLASAADNESGFWEHADIVRIDNALLNALGRDWHDLRPLPEGWMHGEAAKAARAALVETLGEQFHGDALWAVKDPRMCLLLPLWLDVLRELDVEPCTLLVVRHPVEVAQSLQVRDGLPLPQSLWLWLRYTVAAEHATRGLPRAVVGYSSLLEDWRGAMTRAAAAMCIDWPKPMDETEGAIDAFLNVSRRHHERGAVDDADLPLAVRGMHAALLAAEHEGAAWVAAERIADEYVEAEGLFGFGLEAAYAAGGMAKPGDVTVDRELISSLAISVLDEVPGEPAVPPKVRDVAKLYWQRGDDAFNEACVTMIEHAGMTVPTRFAFRLPDGVRFDSVRFDPSVLSGQFEVFGLRVNGQPIDDIASRVLQVHQHRLPSNGPQHVRVLSLDGDPWVRFDLHDCQAEGAGPMEIEITCRYESAREWVRNIIDVAVVSGMASTVQTMTNAVAMNLDAIHSGHDRQIQAVAEQQERMDAHVARIEQKLVDFSDRSARHEASTVQALTKAATVNLDAIRSGHDRQMQAVAEQQERIDAHVARIEQSQLNLSERCAQHEALAVQALTDAMAANLKAVEQEHEVMTRMVGECQSQVDAQAATTNQNLARNLQQLVQVETTLQALLDRLLEGMTVILDNQNRSLWSRLRRK
ncbi:hypothetical protein UUC_09143 [Rhodanobacter denitrificans]|nr:hypothetical protein UUC_09143 [Rhodanobacter denitrificans]